MDFHVIERPTVDLSAWETLVRKESFFQTATWADVCAAGIGRRARAVFLCGFEGNVLKAGMPAIISNRFGLRSFFSMPFGTYGGAAFAPDVDDESKSRFGRWLSEMIEAGRYWQVEISDYNDSLHSRSGCSLVRSRYETHVVDLPEGVEFVPPDKGTSADVRAGEKRGGKIVTVDADRLDEFCRLYRLTEARHGRTRRRYTRDFFAAILQHLGDTGRLHWTGLEADGMLVGSQINFIHGDTLFYWQAVSDYEKRWFKPNHVLLYDAIRYAQANGIPRVNLGGSPRGAASLRKFKEQWGGRPVEYDVYSYRSRLHRLVRG